MNALKAAIIGAIVGVIILFILTTFITRDVDTNQEIILDDVSMSGFSLTSSAFQNNGTIPSRYTCDGDNIGPPLMISGVSEEAKSLVLIMDDPDIPQQFKDERGISAFDHWVLYNIPPDTTELKQGNIPGALGKNSGGQSQYTGPCPPTEFEPTEHRYFFKLYSLDTELSFEETPTKKDAIQALGNHIIQQAELIGRYDRNK